MSLQDEVDHLPWFHSIDFGNGIVSKGVKPPDHLKAEADLYLPSSLDGLTVLEVACWDGYMSFEAYRRGAKRVLATDHFAWSDASWGDRRSFDLAHAHLAPEVEVLDIDVPEITAEKLGTFDIVLFLGVLYHLRYPFQALEQIAPLVRQTLVVSTHVAAMDISQPAMIFYPGKELQGDATNWWGPNPPCVIAMLKDIGFERVIYTPHPYDPGKAGVFHAHR